MMILVHFDEAMIHLMQFSLVISRCNITFSVFWLSQGSVATLTRWGGWSSYCHMCHSFLNLSVKTVLKSVDFWQIQTKITWLVFHGPRCTSTTSPNIITHSLTRIHIQKYFLKISIYGCPIGQAITFCSCGFFFFFFAYSQWSQIGYLPYFNTWCGLSANLRCRSETCWHGSLKIQDAKITQKITTCAPSHKYSRLYLRN